MRRIATEKVTGKLLTELGTAQNRLIQVPKEAQMLKRRTANGTLALVRFRGYDEMFHKLVTQFSKWWGRRFETH